MTGNTLSQLLLTNHVTGCRFNLAGTIVQSEGSFLSDRLAVGADIYDTCDFLVGTIEQLQSDEKMQLDGIHLDIDESAYIVDCIIQREDEDNFVLIMEDQTHRYRIVNQLSQERNQADIMQHQLARQNDQLMILKDAAESAAHTRTEFLAKMSHEIRTPLNALIGFSEMLSESDLAPGQERHVDNIRIAGNALSALLNDILDLSRIESGKYQIEEAVFPLVPMLQDVMSLCRSRAEEKSIDFNLDLDDALPEKVIGDKVRLSQVILNLLTNAIKFTKQGSVTLRVTKVEQTDTSELLVFEVEDTGRGIAEEQQQEIFERFSQSRISDATELGGIGLGLAIVRQLIDAMGGVISVSSEVGKGAIFRIKLGLKRVVDGRGANKTANMVSTPQLTLDGKCILVAEDSKLNQQFVSEVLTARGCQVIVVETGAAAMQAILSEPVDLVLMDVMMPEMTGDEAIKRIRSEFLFPLNRVPIISTNRYEHAQIENKLSEDVSAEMIEIFKAEVPGYLRSLLNALYTQNQKQLVFQAHKLQSAMWVMEFMDLYQILARLEGELLGFPERLALCEEVCQTIGKTLIGIPAAATAVH